MALKTLTTVSSAAQYLDTIRPGWANSITKPVDMSNASRCIAGQFAAAQGTPSGRDSNDLYLSPYEIVLRDWGIKDTAIWVDRDYNAAWQAEVDGRQLGWVDPTPATPQVERVTVLSGNSAYAIDRSFEGLLDLLKHLDVDLKVLSIEERPASS